MASFVFSNGQIQPAKLVPANAMRNSDVFALINKVATDVAASDFDIQDNFKKVLVKPNNLINRFGFWQSVVAQLLLTGNSFVVMTDKNSRGVPTRLEYASDDQVLITLTDYGKDITYTVSWNDERGTVTYSSDDVLHFRLLSPDAGGAWEYIGHSPLESLASDIAIQDESKKLTLSTLKNAINPGYILTVPKGTLEEDAKENIRKSFEAQNSGNNAGRAIVLDQSLSLDTVQINSDVANFLTNYDFSQTQIAKAFGITQAVLNGSKGDQQSNITEIMNFYVSSLLPYLKPIESEISMKFGAECKLNIADTVDLTHQNLINNIATLAAGRTPVLAATQAQQILIDKGVWKMSIQEPASGGM
jgi:HK97 family phage portal protein